MKRRPYLFFLLALFLVTGATIAWFAIRAPESSEASARPDASREREPAAAGGETSEPEAPVVSQPEPSAAEVPGDQAPGKRPSRPLRPGERLRIPVGQPIPEVFPHEKEREIIQGLAATYDAKRIPEIAAFLDHADPLVREAARNGLLQLSSPEAVPVLRSAAAKARNAEEAAALREAATFLSQTGPGG